MVSQPLHMQKHQAKKQNHRSNLQVDRRKVLFSKVAKETNDMPKLMLSFWLTESSFYLNDK